MFELSLILKQAGAELCQNKSNRFGVFKPKLKQIKSICFFEAKIKTNQIDLFY
jgi:hypothetical protein